ncbi:MAG: HDOD domain-containing protein [Oligoflexales bacterium]
MEKVCGSCSRAFRGEEDFLKNTNQWRLCSGGNLWFNCDCGSTLMLPSGKFPWYSPDMVMGEEASSIFNKMSQKGQLPHIPSAVMELQQLLADEEVDSIQLGKAVKKDPFIAAEVMRVCENMRKIRGEGTKKEDPSMEYAITFIGRKQLASLVMVASMKKFRFKTELFDNKKFWDDAFVTAAISEFLWVKVFSQAGKDRAYLAGCLCNIGKIVSAIGFPEKLDRVWKEIYDPQTQDTWSHIEDRSGLSNHCILGEIGAAFWGFPAYVVEAIKNHHLPLPDDNLKEPSLIHIVCLANMLTHWINLEPHRFDEERMYEECKYLDINNTQVEEIVTEVSKLLS